MFDVPPKCPALADKLTGIFGWRHTYRVSQKHRGITHSYLQKSYSLTLPRKGSGSFLKLNLEPESWVAVHHLQTQSGILDPDDCLRDVADDREQILASYEDSGPDPGVQQGGGDGASGSSSVGTGSPDIFRDPTNTDATTGNNHLTDATIPHIEVTSTTSTSGSHSGLGLQVRRSSDPNLIQSLQNEITTNKRWSAAAPACGSDTPERILDKVVYLSPQFEEEDDTQHTYPPQTQNFARSGRLSMQFLGDGNGYKWMEAAEKLQHQQQYQQSSTTTGLQPQYTSKSLPRETSKRKEPLGQAYESIREKDGEMLLIINEYGGPLGLTAIPDREHGGLLVQHVEKDSRAERGRLRKGDRILEINGTKLVGLAEGKVQEHWRRCTATNELRVRVIRANRIIPLPATKTSTKNCETTKVNISSEMVEIGAATAIPVGTKVATVSPTKKIPGAQVGNSLQVANTRKLGRKIDINLKKGLHGLGFSVTTRDNPAGGHCPIYIKNILPRGAAIEDGRLKPGDRLLEVDGVPMTGKSQSDVVAILRATQPGATVKIVVSRQQELAEYEEKVNNFSEEQEDAANIPPKPPAPVLPQPYATVIDKNTSHNSRQIDHKNSNNYINIGSNQHFIDGGSESATSADSIQTGTAWRNREVLTLHIPVHDTEKAGLGVSVKGKTSSGNSSNGSNNSMKHDGDLGIFVKNVLHGGAASRDGRLRMNDQLLSVNGVSLLGQNNAEAMETLRRAMLHTPGKHPGVITLSVARKISRSQSSGDIIEREREREQHDSSNNSEHSGATVIYLSPDKKDQKGNEMNRWSNPVLDRLTGGVCSANSQNNKNKRPSPLMTHGLRNDSYYIATNDTWSSVASDPQMQQMHLNAINNSVLIEDDPEPMSPTLPHRPNDSVSTQHSGMSNGLCDATYSSQLSLDTNNSAEAFSRDAVGRRSISEKHHAALDARETGTYQRNKKLREERERERRIQLTKSAYISDSIDSLTHINSYGDHPSGNRRLVTDLTAEALDKISDLGPSLGMKKSSSLESLQTMVQEIQMSDDTRGGPSALKAPRGRGREDSLRAAVVAGPETKPRKHWLLEDGVDANGGFANRNGPFQSSLNDGKSKSRAKKPSILRGIGHMFRFGKHRKDGVIPIETTSDFGIPPPLPPANNPQQNGIGQHSNERSKSGPPIYQPPPPPGQGGYSNDNYSHRYIQQQPHIVNYEELQHQISRRNPQYYSQRSARSQDIPIHSNQHHKNNNQNSISNYHHHHHHQQQQHNLQHHQQQSSSQPPPQHLLAQIGGRPISSYYEYETIQHNVTPLSGSGRGGTKQQLNNGPNRIPISPTKHWKSSTLNNNSNNTNNFQNINLNGSGRQRGPFVTQVTIRDQSQMISSSSSSSSTVTTNGQQKLSPQPIYGMKHSGQQPHASKV